MKEEMHVKPPSSLAPPVPPAELSYGEFLIGLIQFFVEAYQLGAVRYEPFQMKTGPEPPGRSPDIFFVANEHLSRLKHTYLEGPADLVVEIISRGRDRGDKFFEYEQGGVREYWLIDPLRKQAEFYRRDSNGIYQPMLPSDEGIFRSLVLKRLWLRVEWLWQEPLPTLLSVFKAWELV